MAVSKDFYIDNQPGAPFRSELNTILAALVTANAGSLEPPNLSAGMMWLDTSASPWKLKRRNEQNTGWVIQYDTSNKPTKVDVGLGNVPNYSATDSLTDGSTSKFALASASKNLDSKKLDKTAVAADSAKLGGVAAASYALQTGTYIALRAQATTKGDVDLGNVANYSASASVTLNSNTSYALSSSVFSLNQTKLDKTAVAADSAKLGGKTPSAYALSVHNHTADDLPTATTSAPGIIQLLDSVTSASTTLAAVPKSVKSAYDKGVSAYNLANTAKEVADKALPKVGGDLGGSINYTLDTGDIIKLDGKVVLRRISAAGGVSFGADDAVIIGSGESRNTLQTNVSAFAEETHIGSDGAIKLYTNLQSGWASRKMFQFESDGGFLPGNIEKTRQNLDVPSTFDLTDLNEIIQKHDNRIDKLEITDSVVLSQPGFSFLCKFKHQSGMMEYFGYTTKIPSEAEVTFSLPELFSNTSSWSVTCTPASVKRTVGSERNNTAYVRTRSTFTIATGMYEAMPFYIHAIGVWK